MLQPMRTIGLSLLALSLVVATGSTGCNRLIQPEIQPEPIDTIPRAEPANPLNSNNSYPAPSPSADALSDEMPPFPFPESPSAAMKAKLKQQAIRAKRRVAPGL
jgi:hypothetical protein